MTQTNQTRPQGLNRIDPVLREAAIELGVVEFRAETLPTERKQADLLAAQRAAAVATDGVTVESPSIAGPDGQRLGLRLYRGLAQSPAPLVVYAHGGGFVTGNLDTDHAQCVESWHAAPAVYWYPSTTGSRRKTRVRRHWPTSKRPCDTSSRIAPTWTRTPAG